jgi:penicillin-binding protein 2
VVHGDRGTARQIAVGATYRMAGKTGTSQVIGIGQDRKYDESKIEKRFHDHALFIAFAPVESPRIAVAVLVENGGSGSRSAAPVARQVLDRYLVGPEKDHPGLLLTQGQLPSAPPGVARP